MSRRNNAAARCGQCRLHVSLCLCTLIPRVETATRLVLVMHKLEDRKPTNTGRLGALCLTNSTIVVRGHEGDAPEAPLSFEGTQPLLLFPGEAVTPLPDVVRDGRPVTLVVPDGTWRQASKMQRRVPGLADVPCVGLPAGAPTAYRLRSEPKDGGLATVEAIARAFAVLEGPAVEAAILAVFRAFVERTLWARGELAAEAVAGGIPAGAERHDPKSGANAEAFFRRGAGTLAGGLPEAW